MNEKPEALVNADAMVLMLKENEGLRRSLSWAQNRLELERSIFVGGMSHMRWLLEDVRAKIPVDGNADLLQRIDQALEEYRREYAK